MAVVIFHAQGMAVKYSGSPSISGALLGELGGYGVDLFFVISGFIIRYSEPKTGYDARQFSTRRLQRILPIYWITTALMVGIWVTLPQMYSSSPPGFMRILLSLLFSSQPASGEMPILYVGWSLEYEMLFYLLTSFLLFFRFLPWQPIVILFSTLVAFGKIIEISSGQQIQYPFFRFITSSLLLEFAMGILIGTWFKKQPIEFMSSISLLLALVFVASSDFDSRAFTVGVPSALLVILSMNLERRGSTRIWSPLVKIGDASYSIYLTQVLTLSGAAKLITTLWRGLPPDIFVVITTVIAVMAGYFFYLVVERPFTTFFKKPIMAPTLANSS